MDNELLKEIALANMFESELATLAHKAYKEAKENNTLLRIILKKERYKELMEYYSLEQIINDVLMYV